MMRLMNSWRVCALVNDRQIVVFRVGQGMDVYEIENYDPFGKASVLSRGIVGDYLRDGIAERNSSPKVTSPIYKQNFSLLTGKC